ncbi:hypothetical protein FALBO_11139 [Fusarium albosuccineum]|uniref:Uncharacterized protein n=1 Tax=Fusarium albosuccineum TaxID=1237068 RepID=A0A8H4L5Q6_9HYPO|nr:hypothetical protein FALBO_11139 [Fusarium albosuccineum]
MESEDYSFLSFRPLELPPLTFGQNAIERDLGDNDNETDDRCSLNTSSETLVDSDQLSIYEQDDNLKSQALSTTSIECHPDPTPARRPKSWPTFRRLVMDLKITTPAVRFLAYASCVLNAGGIEAEARVVQNLRSASAYGPTIFPIAFAAVFANAPKAIASWRLERGITVLSLELLLSSRTVFSAFSAPFSIRTFNWLMPVLMILWAVSPLGGQAALRAVSIGPSGSTKPWNVQYLEFRSQLPLSVHRYNPLVERALPAVFGAFSTALSSPPEIKHSSQDAFGNIKIPFIEPYIESGADQDQDGWFKVDPEGNITYSALSGLPFASFNGMAERANYSFALETSYLYTNCSVNATVLLDKEWESYLKKHPEWNNHQTLIIQPGSKPASNGKPREIVFTSWTEPAVANATCRVTTSYVEVDVRCRGFTCITLRIRPVQKPKNATIATVLDGMGPSDTLEFSDDQDHYFFGSFINATTLPSNALWTPRRYAGPIEYYFINPDSPFAATYNRKQGWQYDEIWPIEDASFSNSFSQLLNTFWVASVAPFTITGDSRSRMSAALEDRFPDQYVTGLEISDQLVLQPKIGWVFTLIVASQIMLLAGLFAAVMGVLRRGPDILDRASLLLRDNPNASVGHVGSMEDGFDVATRMKGAYICLGDVKPEDEVGHLTVGALPELVPLNKQGRERLYD